MVGFPPVDTAELQRRMGYHPVKGPEQAKVYEDNRAAAISLGEHLSATCPPGRELSLALTALQECLMWANAAVACAP